MQQYNAFVIIVPESFTNNIIHFFKVILIKKIQVQLCSLHFNLAKFKTISATAYQIYFQRFSPLFFFEYLHQDGAFVYKIILRTIMINFTIAGIKLQNTSILHNQECVAKIILLRFAIIISVSMY